MSLSTHVHDDPRDASLEVPVSPPKTWRQEPDSLSSLSMLLAGGTMVTRNVMIAWPALLLASWGYVNARPLRTKEGGPGVSAVLMASGALLTTYLPRFVIVPSPTPP